MRRNHRPPSPESLSSIAGITVHHAPDSAGKKTLLIALAFSRADRASRAKLSALLGRRDATDADGDQGAEARVAVAADDQLQFGAYLFGEQDSAITRGGKLIPNWTDRLRRG